MVVKNIVATAVTGLFLSTAAGLAPVAAQQANRWPPTASSWRGQAARACSK